MQGMSFLASPIQRRSEQSVSMRTNHCRSSSQNVHRSSPPSYITDTSSCQSTPHMLLLRSSGITLPPRQRKRLRQCPWRQKKHGGQGDFGNTTLSRNCFQCSLLVFLFKVASERNDGRAGGCGWIGFSEGERYRTLPHEHHCAPDWPLFGLQWT